MRYKCYLGLIIIVAALLRFYQIGNKPIWLDESFSIWIANFDLWEGWLWLVQVDQHPPLYYTLLHFWQLILGDTPAAVRSFSAICGVLTVLFLYWACRNFFSQHTAIIAAAILALAPFHVRYSQEARMYALLTLLIAICLYLFPLIFANDGKRSWWWFSLVQAAVMLTHNTATVFFPLALNFFVLGTVFCKMPSPSLPSYHFRSRKFLRTWLQTQLAAFVLWLPWAIPFVIQSLDVYRDFWIEAPTLQKIWWTFRDFNFAYLPHWHFPGYQLWNILCWGLATTAVIRWWKTAPARITLLIVLFLMPIGMSLAISLLRPIFYARTLLWTTLPYYILLAEGIHIATSHYKRTWKVAANLVIWGMIVILSGSSLQYYYRHFKKEAWDQVAAHVARYYQKRDMIVFNSSWVQIPFEYYFRHYKIDANLKGLPVDLFDRGILCPKMTEADVPYMRNLLRDRPRVWLIYSHYRYTDPDLIIYRELGRARRKIERKKFLGIRVILFQKNGVLDD